MLEINTKETRTHRRITIKYGCPALPGASPKVKNEDDGELFAIFKKRRLAKTTTLSTQNNEAQLRGENKVSTKLSGQPTNPPHPPTTTKPKKTTIKPPKKVNNTPRSKKTTKNQPESQNKPREPHQNIKNHFKKQETLKNNDKTNQNSTTTSKQTTQQQETATTSQKPVRKPTKHNQKPLENTILKYTTTTNHSTTQQNQQTDQKQQQNAKQNNNEPTKMAVKIKGKLITDMNQFLQMKKAERERKFLAKTHPPELSQSVPPTIFHPTHHPSSAQSKKESESSAANSKILRWQEDQSADEKK